MAVAAKMTFFFFCAFFFVSLNINKINVKLN